MRFQRIYGSIAFGAILTAVAAFGAMVGEATASGHDTDWKTGKLGHLSKYIGTYDYDAVLDDPYVHKALEEFLGDELRHLRANMQVLSPINFDGPRLVLRGARAHRADEENAIAIVNIFNGKIHAGIFSNGQITIYSKVKSYFLPKNEMYGLRPHALKEWARWNEIRKILNTEPKTNFRWIKENQVATAPFPRMPGPGKRVYLLAGNYGKGRAFIERLFVEAKADNPDKKFSIDDLRIGFLDLNEDGRDEMIVVYYHSYFCGSSGCTSSLYQKTGGNWKLLAGLTVSNNNYITVMDDKVDGYHTFVTGEYAYIWKNTFYKRICIFEYEFGHKDDNC